MAGATLRAYVTLDRVIQQLELDRAAQDSTTSIGLLVNAQDATVRRHLKDLILEISDDVFQLWGRDFVPYVDTLSIRRDKLRVSYSSDEWLIDLAYLPNRDLLSIDTLTINGTSVDSSNYELDDTFGYPVDGIRLNRSAVSNPLTRVNGFGDSTDITGTWGYHPNPSSMWLASGDTVQDSPLSASATSLTVTDADNFETYSYIKIGDEYLFIDSLDTGTNVLTVRRGVNGTTASEHANGTNITTLALVESVAKEVARHVVRAYHLRNGFNIVTAGDTVTDLQEGDFKINIVKKYYMGGV